MGTYRDIGFRLMGGVLAACCVGCCIPVCVNALPDGRVYEMVTPPYKAGYGANQITAVAPDGERVAFSSLGAFAGDPSNETRSNAYIARRGSTGWSTASLRVPATLVPQTAIDDFSGTLELSLADGRPGTSFGNATYDGAAFEYLSHQTELPDAPQNFELAGTVLKALDGSPFINLYKGAAPSLSHILFTASDELLGEAVGTQSLLYDLATGLSGSPRALRLVGINDKRKVFEPQCPTLLGAESGRGSQYNAVAREGNEILFSTGLTSQCEVSLQVFARVGGSKTIEISRPLTSTCNEVPCSGSEEQSPTRAPSEFQGADEAGTRVFFTTAQALGGADSDQGNDLYMASVGCAPGHEGCQPAELEVTSLTQISHGAEPAEVQGVVAIAPDGSHVYFVARGALSQGANPEGKTPSRGADNLYVSDAASGWVPRFVGELCSGPLASGEAEDIGCPADLSASGENNDTGLWTNSHPEAQFNICHVSSGRACSGESETGRFLLFSTYAKLAKGDADATKDVYRYDATAGTLVRVSIGEKGNDDNGNDELYDATIARSPIVYPLYTQDGATSRAISDDGSRVVFDTVAPLSINAVNGLANVYEWHKSSSQAGGEVSLISTGAADAGVEETVMSESGDDVFFKTVQGLVAQDSDGAADIYDARANGGFPEPPGPRQACSSDACQGPLTNPAPLLVPGSAVQVGGENFPPPRKRSPKHKKAKNVKKGRKSARARGSNRDHSLHGGRAADSAGRTRGGR